MNTWLGKESGRIEAAVKKEEQTVQRCHSWFQSWPIWSATEHGAISAFHAAFPAIFTRWCMAWNFKLDLLVYLNSLREWSWHQQNLPVGFWIGVRMLYSCRWIYKYSRPNQVWAQRTRTSSPHQCHLTCNRLPNNHCYSAQCNRDVFCTRSHTCINLH